LGPGTVIFDFDGTLCNSLPELFKIVNSLSKEFGFREIAEAMVPDLREKNVLEVIQTLQVPVYRIPALIKRCRSEIRSRVETMSSFEGLSEQLRLLKGRKIELGIISSNSEANISAFLRKHNWDFFSFVYSGSSLFGKGRLLKKCLAEKSCTQPRTIYVGDEIRDIEGAKKAGVKSIGVSWGFQSRERIKKAGPDAVLLSPFDLSPTCFDLLGL
jgi:phosphoglycolate phosphatase